MAGRQCRVFIQLPHTQSIKIYGPQEYWSNVCLKYLCLNIPKQNDPPACLLMIDTEYWVPERVHNRLAHLSSGSKEKGWVGASCSWYEIVHFTMAMRLNQLGTILLKQQVKKRTFCSPFMDPTAWVLVWIGCGWEAVCWDRGAIDCVGLLGCSSGNGKGWLNLQVAPNAHHPCFT